VTRSSSFLVLSVLLHGAAISWVTVDSVRARPPAAATESALPTLSGDSFEVPAPTQEPEPQATMELPDTGAPSGAAAAQNAAAKTAGRPPSKGAGMAARAAQAAKTTGAEGGGAAGSEAVATMFGAVGDRSAVDLSLAFTRAFPQAASADHAWVQAPLGSTGIAVVELRMDDNGHIEHSSINGSPSPALRAGVMRALSMLGRRVFVSRRKTVRLELVGKVSSDAVHDGLHGDVFAIGASFQGGAGSAFFALAIGRRVDLTIRAL
jgi:hypothetical protein